MQTKFYEEKKRKVYFQGTLIGKTYNFADT